MAHFFCWSFFLLLLKQVQAAAMLPGCLRVCMASTEKWIAEKVERLIEPAIDALGFDVVRVRMTGGTERRVLQVMAEPHDRPTMTVNDCAQISRTISTLLDVEDPIPGEYVLEVSSPGIDRPLVKRRDFDRFAGYEIKIEASHIIDGRRRFRGRLVGIVDDCVRIESEAGEAEIAYDDIASAKLVLTDELLAQRVTG